MEPVALGRSFVLVDRASAYKGWLVIPLAMPDHQYSFAIVDPGDWSAFASDWRDYDSVPHCLSAGRRWIDGFLAQLPSCLVELIERTAQLSPGRMILDSLPLVS